MCWNICVGMYVWVGSTCVLGNNYKVKRFLLLGWKYKVRPYHMLCTQVFFLTEDTVGFYLL